MEVAPIQHPGKEKKRKEGRLHCRHGSTTGHSFPGEFYLIYSKMSPSPLIAPAEGMKHVRSKEGEMLTKPFIERLETKYASDPSKFNLLYDMMRAEIESRTAKSSSSCTNALLWLTRAMDFLVVQLGNLLDHSDWNMAQASMESYNKTLKRWHGWLATSSFTVALKILPERKRFMETIGGGSSDVKADIDKFCNAFYPLLEANHKFLAGVGLDNLKAS